MEKSENIASQNKSHSKSHSKSLSRSHSNMVSVRLDHSTITQLNLIGEQQHLKRSDIARSYLKLCHNVLVKTDQDIQLFDGSRVCFFPKDLLKTFYSKLTPKELMTIGDRMALIAYTNCQIESFQTPLERISYLEQLGWLEINRIRLVDAEGNGWIYHAISAQGIPLDFVHAMLYRLLFQKRMPDELNARDLKENFKKVTKKFKNSALEKLLPRFLKEMGPHIENFDEYTTLYKFDVLREQLGELSMET